MGGGPFRVDEKRLGVSASLTLGSTTGALSFGFAQQFLSNPNGTGCNLHQFVVVNEFECVFQRGVDGRSQQDIFIAAGGTDIGQLFALQRINNEVVVPGMYANDHAFVDLCAMTDK